MTKSVLFVQGGGSGAHEEDAELVRQLRDALGAGYEVHYPRLSNESDPDFERWGAEVLQAANELRDAILVGHSIGGATLLNLLTRKSPGRKFAALHILAAPAWDSKDWNFAGLKMPENAAELLSGIPALFFYHCEDDDVIPFAHLALHRTTFPQATFRSFSSGGHQFTNHLQDVARDIVKAASGG